MTAIPPSPMIAFDDEKDSGRFKSEADAEAGKTAIPVVEEDVSSSDGDDALRLAGVHAHHFDEKYMARLRWKIVSYHLL